MAKAVGNNEGILGFSNVLSDGLCSRRSRARRVRWRGHGPHQTGLCEMRLLFGFRLTRHAVPRDSRACVRSGKRDKSSHRPQQRTGGRTWPAPASVQTALTVAICGRRSSPPGADNGNIFLAPARAASKAGPVGVFHSPATAAGGLPSAADTCFRPCGREPRVREAPAMEGNAVRRDAGRWRWRGSVRARPSRRQRGPRGRPVFGTFGFRTRRRRGRAASTV